MAHGVFGFETFSHQRTVLIRPSASWLDLPQRYPPCRFVANVVRRTITKALTTTTTTDSAQGEALFRAALRWGTISLHLKTLAGDLALFLAGAAAAAIFIRML